MLCPVPPSLAEVPYVTLGDGSDSGPCAMQGSGDHHFFDLRVDECNVTRTEAPGRINMTATFVPHQGTLIFADDSSPTLICECTYDTVASVSSSASVFIDEPTQDVTGDAASFDASLAIFHNASYEEPLQPGEAFPATSGRFFFQVSTASEDDVLGLQDCTVAPTGEEDDEFTYYFFNDFCPEAMFDIRQELGGPGVSNTTTHIVQWSAVKFKFAGYPRVHVSCTVVRCGPPPACTCTAPPGGRRLGRQRRRLQQNTEGEGATGQATLDFVLPPGDYLVLPGTVPEASKVAAYDSSLLGPPSIAYTRSTNVTIYGLPTVANGMEIARQFRIVIGPYIGQEVHVHGVWQVPGSRISDATTFGFFHTANGTTEHVADHLAEALRTGGFIDELLQAMGVNSEHSDTMQLQVESAEVRNTYGMETTNVDAASETPDVVIIALVVTAVVLVAAAAAIGVLVMRRQRARGKASHQGTAESADTSDEAMEAGDQRPAGGPAEEGAGKATDEEEADFFAI